jgi:cytochrome P450
MKTVADLPILEFSDDDAHGGRLTSLMVQMAQQHGPICRGIVPGGPGQGRELVFMIGPEANRFVFHTHRTHFSHAQGWGLYLDERLGKGLLNMDPPEHTAHRQIWNPAFTAAHMDTYWPIMQQVIAARVGTWAAESAIDIYAEARALTFDVAAAALAGFPLGPAIDRLRELFYTLVHGTVGAGEARDILLQRMQQARLELVQMLLALIAQRRQQPQTGDVLSMILQAGDAQELRDEQVLAHLNILLVAGHETTTTLAARTLNSLATYPEYQQRVRAEMEEALGDLSGPPPLAIVRGLKFLDAVIREVGRLYPPVLMVPRGVIHPFTFAGYTVPAGTQVRLALAASHMLPGVFARPEQFDPNRFLPPRDEERRHPYALVTFGGGPRLCIGINFAQVEVKSLVTQVLQRYYVERVDDHPVPHTGFWIAFVPPNLRLRLIRR